ncbi:DUF2726 domain-containing protein [Shewanella insulae]|uniref:DUF2726 domain-containing protein n=2 Tax=Shewanella insulae TaxID=2681496 RepID=A0A6L7I0R0_9GAMM|nr:DUF2726 domain-containing protein [Shewanella insulae]MCG9738017.1 DUF2726 domain-containing protein [Shewanella insulae]MCG9757420.1 DUF2726 domain-containing protein [Shewanella insulae]MXR70116.1 DUF2726 domain-containing protein [Shewanella insulae]
MNTTATVILSYAFMYFVLFVICPLVIVTFVMTCIKFFSSSEAQLVDAAVSIKPHLLDKESMHFLKGLKAIAANRYDILYGASLVNVVDIDDSIKNHDEVQDFMEHCHLDYVVVDNESSAVKLVVSNPAASSPEQMKFVEKCLDYIGVQFIKLDKDKHCDEALLRTALAA